MGAFLFKILGWMLPSWTSIFKIFGAMLPYILDWAWKKADADTKKRVSAKEFVKWMEPQLKKYESLILKIDELKDQGLLTKEQADKLEKEKIAIETDLLNGHSRRHP